MKSWALRNFRLSKDGLPIDKTETLGIAESERNILRDRHSLDETQILVDKTDRKTPQGIACGLSSEPYDAFIRRINAGQDFHNG